MRRRAVTARLFEVASTTGSAAERASIIDEIVRLNMPVAGDIARRYHGRGIDDEDLDQVANLGLVKAARGFDPALGHDFLSYAVPSVRGEVRRHFRDFGWAIRPPRSVQELQGKLTAAEGELYQTLGRSPRPSEIAAHLGADLELVLEALAANGCFAPTSLDAPLSDDDHAAGDRLGGLDGAFAGAEARVALAGVLTGLTARERRMLEMRFWGGCTQAEIGADVGISQMQVSRLLNRLFLRLRKRLVEENVIAA